MVVSGQPEVDVAWGDAQRRRLQLTREHAKHDMDACVEVLRMEFGVDTASQPNLSRWETGAIKRPGCTSELLAYCDTYGPHIRSTAPAPGESGTGQLSNADSTELSQVPGDEIDEFGRLAGQAAGEPLLGLAQLELVRGMSRRLASGPPLSPEDRATYLDQLRILRLPDA